MTTAAHMRDTFAVVTGASTGIGAAIAERLAASGVHLVLVARSADRLDEAAERLSRRHGVTVRAFPLDLAAADAPTRLAKSLADEGIEVEVLVNNAGLSARGPVLDGDPARFRSLIDLNVTALTELTTLLVPAMVARGHGAVVNIASTGGYVPAPYLAVYAATKAYVVSFTQALWAETRGTGVRVVVVSPGPTKTPMNTRGTRSAEAVATTVVRALSGNGPAVIDGRANALGAHLFGRLLPTRLVLAIARRVMARSGT
ncbi:SDR family NAD(P)-dependent oxidoreductase [Actinokineospora sp. PR83]|uniref:SDR family NAD(P)-dependent oxidoreductase n=1 Tax=Actinokineospora sp. PR83 TaxID=2884908 RepID=UPI001F2DC43A|nr:SDR family NAD(P)-dependent oxidoreductase [Actinokineospora sp. PR83]MCG8914491.1 SDR family NAD(P)-dependent oxidoreductase [Actinokineospora sp. PR83]